MKDQTATQERGSGSLARFLPLAGVGFAVLTIAGDLTIGEFPDPESSLAELSTYYAAHADSVRTGGQLMIWGRSSSGSSAWPCGTGCASPRHHLVVAGLVLVGTAIAVTSEPRWRRSLRPTGNIGADSTVTPEALQAWHVGSQYRRRRRLPPDTGTVRRRRRQPGHSGLAGMVGARARNRQLTPFSFYATMLFLLWAAVAGVVLSVRSAKPIPSSGAQPVATARA